MNVFPARAGMSPSTDWTLWMWQSVPRASGDEPGGKDFRELAGECSPRERG